MVKIGRNDPCKCGSGKKYKICCLNKKPRMQSVMVGLIEPLSGFHYDNDKMDFMGLTCDGRLIKPDTIFSQTHYIGQSGKEKVITRVQEKVIPNEADLVRHLLSSFDMIIAVDTNTKIIECETVSVTGIVHCVVQNTSDPDIYDVSFRRDEATPFRNCPRELHPEKSGWITEIERINREPLNKMKRFALVTDHDLDNHASYNSKQMPIFKNFYLPGNFTLMYGRGDGPSQSLLNRVVKQCDKNSSELLKKIEEMGYCQHNDKKYSINQIPVPGLESL